jgi:hypothetical protein
MDAHFGSRPQSAWNQTASNFLTKRHAKEAATATMT